MDLECSRCHAALPDVAHFCHACGQDRQRAGDAARRKSFAVKPDEPVAKLALISSIMPRGATERPQTYRIALVVALALALGCAIVGALPLALMVAAFAIPIVYVVYLYDVNLWEDEPVMVTGLAFGFTFLAALAFTWTWQRFLLPRPRASFERHDAPTLMGVVLLALLVPVVGELIRQVAPVLLASRARFDDLMDGFTFGIVAGVAYAAAETLIMHWDLMRVGFAGPEVDSLKMASLMFLHGFVKPLLYGTATAIAAAEFSGLGRGHDGFTARYVRNVALAIVAVAAFLAGNHLLGFLDVPGWVRLVLGILLGLAIVALLILRARHVLHVGLMEAALESSARAAGVGADGDLEFCPACELPLLPHSTFCSACGAATRTGPKGSGRGTGGATSARPVGATVGATNLTHHDEEGPA